MNVTAFVLLAVKIWRFLMSEEQYLITLSLFAKSEGYDLKKLLVEGDFETVEMLSDKMRDRILLSIKDIFGYEK